VDVTRQVLADYASMLQQTAALMYKTRDEAGFKDASEDFLELIDDMDKLLGTREEFLLGKWLSDARNVGHTQQEKDLYEQNARNQITLWGNKDCRIKDYACKHWNGMMSGFYKPRWERFFTTVSEAMEQGEGYDEDAFIQSSKDWEWEWTLGHEEYASEPVGSAIEECLRIWDKYHQEILNLQDHFIYKEDVAAYV
jgi:alpha-N-acetylglucosaminidase